MPSCYIIAGPNGAGKTTFARKFLPDYADCTNFVNADLIAQGISPLAPDAAAFRAGRMMLAEIAANANLKRDFGFEATLSGRSYVGLIGRLRQRGYAVHIFFIWVDSAVTALNRVRFRVTKGGHDVPADVILRRYERSMMNFSQVYSQPADSWVLVDNSGEQPRTVALADQGEVVIMDPRRYKMLADMYGKP